MTEAVKLVGGPLLDFEIKAVDNYDALEFRLKGESGVWVRYVRSTENPEIFNYEGIIE